MFEKLFRVEGLAFRVSRCDDDFVAESRIIGTGAVKNGLTD